METINGKKVELVLDELSKPFYQNEIRVNESTKEAYISACTIQKRLDRVLGKHMWSFVVVGQTLNQLGDKLYSFGTGIITVYTDAGIAISRSASGCVSLYGNVNVAEEATKKLEGFGKALSDDIFVKACQKFGIGNLSEEQKTQKKSLSEAEIPVSGTKQAPNAQQTYQVEVLGEFAAMPRGGAKCQVRYQGKIFSLYVWKEAWDLLNKSYPQSFAIGKRLNSLSFIGKKKLFRGKEQLEFISLPNAS